MKYPGSKWLWLLAVAAAPGLGAPAATPGTNAPGPRSPARLDFPTPPVPAGASPPVAFFRELLKMTPPERNKALADRSPEKRKRILAKIREYESLNPDYRELQLRVTELGWYLVPLMKADPTNRMALAQEVPAELRGLVEDRLRAWAEQPPGVQKELLENEATLRYFTAIAGSSEQQQRRIMASLSPARRKKLEDGVRQWQALPAEQQKKIMARFDEAFDLTPPERERMLRTLSDAERQQIEKTLQNFGQLTSQQRRQCIASFEKFASLSTAERQQFLKNAEQWKLMTPAERQAWRDVVSHIPMLPVVYQVPPRPTLTPPPRSAATN